jgi:hypothetical protein
VSLAIDAPSSGSLAHNILLGKLSEKGRGLEDICVESKDKLNFLNKFVKFLLTPAKVKKGVYGCLLDW